MPNRSICDPAQQNKTKKTQIIDQIKPRAICPLGLHGLIEYVVIKFNPQLIIGIKMGKRSPLSKHIVILHRLSSLPCFGGFEDQCVA